MKTIGRKLFTLLGLATMTAFVLLGISGCAELDVVGKQSVKSFEAVLAPLGDGVLLDYEYSSWGFSSPDGEASFSWSAGKYRPGFRLEVNAQPFINAGLKPSKLPKGIEYNDDYRTHNSLIFTMTNGILKNSRNLESDDAVAVYKRLIELYPNAIGYHTAMDHYNISIGEGNMFEWAKDLTTNDKDIVFALNPQPFIDAGVDVNAIEGWTFTKVPVEMGGKAKEVDKLLKVFNLE